MAEPVGSGRYVRSDLVMRRVVNPLTLLLGGPTLTVRGRRSDRPVRAVVPPFAFEGSRYLVSGGGQTHWVRNLRAAGSAELSRGRSHEAIRVVELDGDARDRMVAAYRVRMGRRGRAFFASLPDPADHPVFRIEPAGLSGERPAVDR